MEATSSVTTAPAGSSAPRRRADAGAVRLTGRDVAGLLLAGDMYGAPYDLMATFLAVRADRLRGIVARWRRAGYAQTARLGPGPALSRLAHIRAVLAIRLSLEAGDPPAPSPQDPTGRPHFRIWHKPLSGRYPPGS